MSTANPIAADRSGTIPAIIRTGLLVFVVDALFASSTGYFMSPRATPLRVFQGVASVPFGKEMLTGGWPTGAIGLLIHLCVALFWSTLFVLALRESTLRNAIESWLTAWLVATAYGLTIWLVMTLIVIPSFVHHGPALTPRYWVQMIGHIPFVAMTMILTNRGRARPDKSV